MLASDSSTLSYPIPLPAFAFILLAINPIFKYKPVIDGSKAPN